jgi:hypothetical protein
MTSRSQTLRRFHGVFPLFWRSESVSLREKLACGRFEAAGTALRSWMLRDILTLNQQSIEDSPPENSPA